MDTETAFDLLNHEYRRAAVGVLHETSQLSRPELTARVATRAIDCESPIGRPDEETRHRVRIGLHHDHLPKLADADVLEYDEATVAAGPELETLASYLEVHRPDSLAAPDVRERLAEFYA